MNYLIILEEERDEVVEVLGYTRINCIDEESAYEHARWRGQLCDMFGLYLDCPIPDNFKVEVITEEEYWREYGPRMPLTNYKPWK